MRTFGKLSLALTGAFLFVSLLGGQQPGGGGRFQIPGFGNDPLSLLQNDSVKKELNMTDEQSAKLPDAVLKAVANVLDGKQLKRLKEIELQQRGSAALADAGVQKDLKLSEGQSKSIKTILEDSGKQRQELFNEAKGGGGGFQGMREKFQALQKETNEKIQEVLSTEQRRAWKELLGDEFKIERPGFGGEFKKGKRKVDLD
ncbi:MAG: hypothetical protein HY040_26150 [Planctomycetes bacterium]|nr:hypothetical protein [Planctomycetota bacterium]